MILDRIIIWLLAAALALFPPLVSFRVAQAQSPQVRALLLAPRPPAAISAAYQGPGDAKAVTWFFWGSCARAFSASFAGGAGSICDLVQSPTGASPGTAVCTLKIAANGFVDQTAYCPGSLTPSAACAAVTGGCRISTLYDQSGNSRPQINATNASQPAITFSSSPNGTLPVMTGGSAVTQLYSPASYTINAPITYSAVYVRTAAPTAAGQLIGSGSGGNSFISAGNSANTAQVNGGTSVTASATDSSWHSLQGLISNSAGNCAINVDGSDTASLTCGTAGFSADYIRIFRNGTTGTQMQGSIAEIGFYAATSTASDRNAVSSNQHSASNGYNF